MSEEIEAKLREKLGLLKELTSKKGSSIKEEKDGKDVEKEVENIFVSSPAIYKNDELSVMFPNEARLKNLTYHPYKNQIIMNHNYIILTYFYNYLT